MYRLKRIVRQSGPTHAIRTHRTLKDTLMAFAATGGRDLLEERAKEKLKSFLEATRDIKSIHTSLLTFHKKSKLVLNNFASPIHSTPLQGQGSFDEPATRNPTQLLR